MCAVPMYHLNGTQSGKSKVKAHDCEEMSPSRVQGLSLEVCVMLEG
jgi:hypothetical protein